MSRRVTARTPGAQSRSLQHSGPTPRQANVRSARGDADPGGAASSASVLRVCASAAAREGAEQGARAPMAAMAAPRASRASSSAAVPRRDVTLSFGGNDTTRRRIASRMSAVSACWSASTRLGRQRRTLSAQERSDGALTVSVASRLNRVKVSVRPDVAAQLPGPGCEVTDCTPSAPSAPELPQTNPVF